MLSKLEIEFDFVAVNNRTMSLDIVYNNSIVWTRKSLPEDNIRCVLEIVFPAKISLIFTGRTGQTTLIDEHQNIIKNMSINIKKMHVDGLEVCPVWVENNVITECDDSDEIIIGPCLCANGRADLFFNEPDAFKFIVKSNEFLQRFSISEKEKNFIKHLWNNNTNIT